MTAADLSSSGNSLKKTETKRAYFIPAGDPHSAAFDGRGGDRGQGRRPRGAPRGLRRRARRHGAPLARRRRGPGKWPFLSLDI